jgi:transcriptional antiterminator NusG
MEWYSLRVISGKEKQIKEAILFEISHSDSSEMVKDILVPTENIIEMKEGKKKVRERTFFPGYILIKMEITKESKYLVENINGVINMV